MRKPAIDICEIKGTDQLHGHCTLADQRSDHFLGRLRDICAFFHSKSHENCLKERKNRTDKFS